MRMRIISTRMDDLKLTEHQYHIVNKRLKPAELEAAIDYFNTLESLRAVQLSTIHTFVQHVQ